jgi:hypothetical protein
MATISRNALYIFAIDVATALRMASGAAVFLISSAMMHNANAASEHRALVGYYPSWLAATTQPLTATPDAYTHVVIAFAKPDFAWDGTSWTGTGLQFAASPNEVRGQIEALHARGIRVLLTVGGAKYLNWAPLAAEASKAGNITAALKTFVADIGFDGLDVDYETEGADPAQISEYAAVITALRNAAGPDRMLALAAWSTGADCTPATGTQACGGKLSILPGRSGRERLVFRDTALLNKINMISVMSYDAGYETFDAVRAWSLYRDLVPTTITVNIGFEIAPEGWGGAKLVASEADAICSGSIILGDQFGDKVGKPYSVSRLLRDGPLSHHPNSNPRDGAMLWHITKVQAMPSCGNPAVVPPRELELTARALLDRGAP